MGKIMALDYGSVRTGIALSDENQIIAFGYTTISTSSIFDFLKEFIQKEKPEIIVVGQPKRFDNSFSDIENEILEFINKFETFFPYISVERQDERFTSKIASFSLIESGMKKKHRKNKELLDEISATLILQAFLDKKSF